MAYRMQKVIDAIERYPAIDKSFDKEKVAMKLLFEHVEDSH
jgi:hypothetical protein